MNKVIRCIVPVLFLALALVSCSGPSQALAVLATATATSHPVFVIPDEQFSASPACDGEGTILNSMKDGKLIGTAQDDVHAKLIDPNGMPGPWCSGFKHVWQGTGTFQGYTIQSDPNDPLVFMVDRAKGYYYLQGKGTVIFPDGKKFILP